MQDEEQIRQAIAHSWAHTTKLSTAALDLQGRLFELDMAQLRLQTQVTGAVVPEQGDTAEMSMSEVVAYLQAGLGKPHQGTATDDHELQVFEMYRYEEEVEVNAVGDVSGAATLKEVEQAQADNSFAADMMKYVTMGELLGNKAKAKTVATRPHVYGLVERALVRTTRSKHGRSGTYQRQATSRAGLWTGIILSWHMQGRNEQPCTLPSSSIGLQ